MSVTTKERCRVALVGANGMLARMIRARAPEGVDFACYDLPEFDMTDRASVLAVLAAAKPAVIINCAAFTAVDACEEREEFATRVNADGVANLAAAARDLDATLVHISTDYVFAGDQERPYREDDPVGPLSAYGRSKLKGEQALIDSGLERFYIVRTSWLYGPGGKNFVETILRLAAERDELGIVGDQVGGPTYTADLADAIFNLLGGDAIGNRAAECPYGIYHFADEGSCSWHGFACAIVEEARLHGLPVKVREIRAIRTVDYPLPARRPAYSLFDKSKYLRATGAAIPAWRESLRAYFAVRQPT